MNSTKKSKGDSSTRKKIKSISSKKPETKKKQKLSMTKEETEQQVQQNIDYNSLDLKQSSARGNKRRNSPTILTTTPKHSRINDDRLNSQTILTTTPKDSRINDDQLNSQTILITTPKHSRIIVESTQSRHLKLTPIKQSKTSTLNCSDLQRATSSPEIQANTVSCDFQKFAKNTTTRYGDESEKSESSFLEDNVLADEGNHSSCQSKKIKVQKESNVKENKLRYAAIRLYGVKDSVQIISINNIKEFNSKQTKFPYDAFAAAEKNEDNEWVYEPAAILAVSNSRSELQNRSKRWSKSSKRKSTVIHELAQAGFYPQQIAEKEKVNKKKKPLMNAASASGKENAGTTVQKAKQQMQEKIDLLSSKKLNFTTAICRSENRQRETPNTPIVTPNHLRVDSNILNSPASLSPIREREKENSSKKIHKKSKYVRKIKACLYDSDDYDKSDSEKRARLTKWKQSCVDENGYLKQENMFHLHYGVSVPYKSWKSAIQTKSSYGFLRALVTPHIWPLDEFVKRAVQIKRTVDSHDRVELTPKKKEAIKKGYVQYLVERGIVPANVKNVEEKKKRDARINKFGRELGIIIAQERAKFIEKNEEEASDEKDNVKESEQDTSDNEDRQDQSDSSDDTSDS